MSSSLKKRRAKLSLARDLDGIKHLSGMLPSIFGYFLAIRLNNYRWLCYYIYIYMIPVPGPVAPPPPPPQWYAPPPAVPQTSRLHAVCRLSPQLRAICCVWVMSSLVCGLFASIWDLRFLICRLLEASMHFCLYYVLIPRHVYCHHHSCLASVLLMCCWHLI